MTTARDLLLAFLATADGPRQPVALVDALERHAVPLSLDVLACGDAHFFVNLGIDAADALLLVRRLRRRNDDKPSLSFDVSPRIYERMKSRDVRIVEVSPSDDANEKLRLAIARDIQVPLRAPVSAKKRTSDAPPKAKSARKRRRGYDANRSQARFIDLDAEPDVIVLYKPANTKAVKSLGAIERGDLYEAIDCNDEHFFVRVHDKNGRTKGLSFNDIAKILNKPTVLHGESVRLRINYAQAFGNRYIEEVDGDRVYRAIYPDRYYKRETGGAVPHTEYAAPSYKDIFSKYFRKNRKSAIVADEPPPMKSTADERDEATTPELDDDDDERDFEDDDDDDDDDELSCDDATARRTSPQREKTPFASLGISEPISTFARTTTSNGDSAGVPLKISSLLKK